jgi:hypothetical protein
VPEGWKVTVRQPKPIVSLRLPVSASAAVTVTAPAGAALTAYPVSVQVAGAQPVSATASVVVSEPLTCASSSDQGCALDLGPQLTRDGTATASSSAEGNFDGGGWSFDADLLPAAGPVTWDGVTYNAPSPGGTAANFAPAAGQSLLLPSGHGAVHLVMTSHNGPVSGGLTVGYTDGSYASVPLTVADWCGNPAAGTTTVLAMDHRIKAGQGVDGPPVKLFGVTVPAAAGKQVRSLTLPAATGLYVYAVTLT